MTNVVNLERFVGIVYSAVEVVTARHLSCPCVFLQSMVTGP